MKNQWVRWITGGLFVVLGLLIAIGPHTFFSVCDGFVGMPDVPDVTMPQIPMKCHWTAMAEIGVGSIIALIGLAMMYFSQEQIRFAFSLILVPLGLFTILLPTSLIGVCGNAMHECRTQTLPMLWVLGIAVMVISLINGYFLYREGVK